MQENKDCIVLVHINLLLHEKEFEKLRELIPKLDLTELESYDEFVYDSDKDEVTCNHKLLHPNRSNLNLICGKAHNGYILTDLQNLKKLLSL